VSWSYDLLDEAERRLLARLSVLRGGFDLEVAERVAGGEPLAPQAVAGLLASLAGKSLVQVQAGPVVRYWLLETVRQFAAGRLASSGEETAVHARLLGWALDEARSAEATPSGSERTGWSDRLSAGQASIRAALSWALGGAEPEAGRELAARLARWWIATGRYSEAGQFLTAAAGIPSPRRPPAAGQSSPPPPIRSTLGGHAPRSQSKRDPCRSVVGCAYPTALGTVTHIWCICVVPRLRSGQFRAACQGGSMGTAGAATSCLHQIPVVPVASARGIVDALAAHPGTGAAARQPRGARVRAGPRAGGGVGDRAGGGGQGGGGGGRPGRRRGLPAGGAGGRAGVDGTGPEVTAAAGLAFARHAGQSRENSR
jgi:hypothetical protein